LNSFLRLREDEVDILTDKDHKIFKTIRDKLLPKLQTDYGYSEPEPYLVVLCADGDRMGQALSNIDLSEKHRKFSRQLTEFAGKARELVRKHSGCLIYSGGDDVLAFVPADKSLGCARELHDEFGKLLETWKDKEGKSPTLSVGLAIGHCLEHLEDLLNYARAAEKAAKEPDRDGLAVHLHPRGGPPVKVRGQWTDKLDERLLRWAGMHLNEQISDKTVYDLRMLARDYASWPDTVETDKAIEKDIQRLLSRKQADGHKPDTAAFAQDIERCFQRNRDESHRDYHPGVMQLAEEWLIARRLAKVMRQAREKNALSDEVRK
jgi:CRISPR/Cas system-associated protein Cas10 (large subunit of type III CRISPR-Cas system)